MMHERPMTMGDLVLYLQLRRSIGPVSDATGLRSAYRIDLQVGGPVGRQLQPGGGPASSYPIHSESQTQMDRTSH
jgi:hypothetical protein